MNVNLTALGLLSIILVIHLCVKEATGASGKCTLKLQSLSDLVVTMNGEHLNDRIFRVIQIADKSELKFRCKHLQSYLFFGNRIIHCNNGLFSAPFPICLRMQPRQVNVPPSIHYYHSPNASVVDDDGKLLVYKGEKLTLSCLFYRKKGEAKWTVQRGDLTNSVLGDWNSEEDAYDLTIPSEDLINGTKYTCCINDVHCNSIDVGVTESLELQPPTKPQDKEQCPCRCDEQDESVTVDSNRKKLCTVLKGERGMSGVPGLDGLPGFPGPRGFPGLVGPPGSPCSYEITDERRPPSPPGPHCSNMMKGEKGERGFSGLPGLPGSKGDKGDAMIIVNEEGKQTPFAMPGTKGERGIPGLPGPAGRPGTPGKVGNWLVMHSQTNATPECEIGHLRMWEGYSLLYVEESQQSHYQDLGSVDSCISRFSTLPFLSCDFEESRCHYALQSAKSYWLSTNAPIPKLPLSGDAIRPHISRCVVCEVPSNVLAVHSQSLNVPDCPEGWKSLWIGYSFFMNLGQSLTTPGSCLMDFRPIPFIECDSTNGTCHYPTGKHSYWMATIDTQDMFTKPEHRSLEYGNMLSRCTVCMKD